MRYLVTLDEREIEVDLSFRPDGTVTAVVGGKSIEIDVLAGRSIDDFLARSTRAQTGALALRHVRDGRMIQLLVHRAGPEVRFAGCGARGFARVESARARDLLRAQGRLRLGAAGSSAGASSAGGALKAPMPGRIVRVLVEAGAAVEPGVPLLVIEAMKMENELRAAAAGVVGAVRVKPGDAVEAGAELVVFA